MASRTKIGLGDLVKDRGVGSVDLPEEVLYLCCPNCGTQAGLIDQRCPIQFKEVFNEEKTLVMRLQVDCRECGCNDKEPMQQRTWDFLHAQVVKKQ